MYVTLVLFTFTVSILRYVRGLGYFSDIALVLSENNEGCIFILYEFLELKLLFSSDIFSFIKKLSK